MKECSDGKPFFPHPLSTVAATGIHTLLGGGRAYAAATTYMCLCWIALCRFEGRDGALDYSLICLFLSRRRWPPRALLSPDGCLTHAAVQEANARIYRLCDLSH